MFAEWVGIPEPEGFSDLQPRVLKEILAFEKFHGGMEVVWEIFNFLYGKHNFVRFEVVNIFVSSKDNKSEMTLFTCRVIKWPES